MENKEKRKFHILSPSQRENWKMYIYKFSRNPLSVIGLVIVVITLFLAIFGRFIVPYPESLGAFADITQTKQPPSLQHLFGTDLLGRDNFSRCIYAFGDAMKMAVIVLAISIPVGVILGLIAGYYRGKAADFVVMRIADVCLALPSTVLALCIAAMLEPNMTNSLIAITVTWWAWYARMVYASAASYSRGYFVKSAELVGASKAHILFKEILPNCLSPVLTKATLDVGWVILTGATLSFVGLGVQPPEPAFGSMISDSMQYMPEQWWLTVFPALCIAFIILGFNLFGDGIRDMLDRGRT